MDLLTFHAGFIPDDAGDPIFAKMADRLGRSADAATQRGVRIGLESGQESAAALKQFLAALDRPNVGCNFDPANMILYGRQQPIEAVDLLARTHLPSPRQGRDLVGPAGRRVGQGGPSRRGRRELRGVPGQAGVGRFLRHADHRA